MSDIWNLDYFHLLFQELSTEKRQEIIRIITDHKKIIVKLPDALTISELNDIAISYRHDFGLTKTSDQLFGSGMTDLERENLLYQIQEFYKLIKGILIQNYKHD